MKDTKVSVATNTTGQITRNAVNVIGRLLPPSVKIHQNQEVYWAGGLIRTLKGTDYKNPPFLLIDRRDYESKENRSIV